MRYRLALLIFATGICLASGASARSLHNGLSVVMTPPDGGRVLGCDRATPIDCLDCPTYCSTGIAEYSSISLTAEPGPGRVFGGWGGDCSGTGTCSLSGDAPHVVSASFEPTPPPPPPKFDVTVTKAGSGAGYVGGGGGIDCGPTCKSSQGLGTKFQLVALADAGSTFGGWDGACSGKDPCQVTISAAASVTAAFERLTPTVKALASTGVRGEQADLRYLLPNPLPDHREGMVVLDGKRVAAKIRKARTRIVDDVYFIPWRVPPSLRTGDLRFCIVALDPLTSRTAQSCARLRIR